MSILNQIKKSGGNSGKAWLPKQIALAVGLSLDGASRQLIADATGHPVNSVTYLFTRKLKTPQLDDNGKVIYEEKESRKTGEIKKVPVMRDLNDEELFEACQISSAEEIEQMVKDYLNPGSTEESVA